MNDSTIIHRMLAYSLLICSSSGCEFFEEAAATNRASNHCWTRIDRNDPVFGGRIGLDSDVEMLSVTASADLIVAVGFRDYGNAGRHASVWISSDGFNWDMVPESGDEFSREFRQEMRSVAALPSGGFIAAGFVEDPPVFTINSSFGHRSAAIWTSPNGVDWTRVTSSAFDRSGYWLVMNAVAPSTVGSSAVLVAVGYTQVEATVTAAPYAQAWESTDSGATWTRKSFSEKGVLQAVSVDGSGNFLAVGSVPWPSYTVRDGKIHTGFYRRDAVSGSWSHRELPELNPGTTIQYRGPKYYALASSSQATVVPASDPLNNGLTGWVTAGVMTGDGAMAWFNAYAGIPSLDTPDWLSFPPRNYSNGWVPCDDSSRKTLLNPCVAPTGGIPMFNTAAVSDLGFATYKEFLRFGIPVIEISSDTAEINLQQDDWWQLHDGVWFAGSVPEKAGSGVTDAWVWYRNRLRQWRPVPVTDRVLGGIGSQRINSLVQFSNSLIMVGSDKLGFEHSMAAAVWRYGPIGSSVVVSYTP